MIDKIHGLYIAVCDYCGETLDEYDDFYDAVDSTKAAGWRYMHIGPHSFNYCPKCYQDINKNGRLQNMITWETEGL